MISLPYSSKWTTLCMIALTAMATASLCGCGLTALTEADIQAANQPVAMHISGRAVGGEQGVTGATVTIYNTKNNGVAQTGGYYSGTANSIVSTTTDQFGNFNFTTGPTCTSPDQVYLVANGGNTGGNSVNNNEVLMAAIGDCSNLTSSLSVVIDEETTVAAAYALNRFMTLSGTTVNVTSSATNYAGTSGKGTPTNAAGLAHAFLNANNLASYSSGYANSAVPGNTASTVPSAVLNTLASILQNCVNSSGGVGETFSTPVVPTATAGSTASITFLTTSAGPPVTYATTSGTVKITFGGTLAGSTTNPLTGTITAASPSTFITQFNAISAFSSNNIVASANGGNGVTITGPAGTSNTLSFTGTALTNVGDGSGCGQLFAATTTPAGVVPTNTLQAAMNIAQYPANNAAALFLLVPTTPAFQPVLPKGPTDFIIGINYQPQTTSIGQTANLYSNYLTLDANDQVYAEIMYPSISAATADCITSFSSSGTLESGTGWNCNVGQGALVEQLAADQNGYLWITDESAATTTPVVFANGIQQVSASTGALKATFTPYESATHTTASVAVDKTGNVWFTSNGSGGALSEIVYSSSGPSWAASVHKAAHADWTSALGMAIDSSQNVWGSGSTASAGVAVFPNGAAADATAVYATTLTNAVYGVSIDKNGAGWVPYYVSGTGSTSGHNNSASPFTFTSGTTPTVAAGATGEAAISNNDTYLSYAAATEVDGSNTLWFTVKSPHGVTGYNINLDSATFGSPYPASMPGASGPYEGCLATTATSCGDVSTQLFGTPIDVQVDSTGSMWVSGGYNATNTSGDLVQLIGIAAPTWPLLASGKPGVMP